MKVVYVVACTHSGSTLLGRILNQLEGVFSAGELQYLDRYWGPTGRPCSCGEHVVRCPLWSRVFWRLHESDLDMVPFSRVSTERSLEWAKALTGRYGERGKNLFPTSNRLLFETLHEVTGAQVVVDNSKDLWRLKPLVDAFPDEVWVVHLVRAPETHIASQQRRKGTSFLRAAWLKWYRVNVLARRIGGRARHYRQVRYEDLVEHPERTIEALAGWLGVPYRDPFAGAIEPAHEINPNRETQSAVAESLRPDPARVGTSPARGPLERLVLTFLRRSCYERR